MWEQALKPFINPDLEPNNHWQLLSSQITYKKYWYAASGLPEWYDKIIIL